MGRQSKRERDEGMDDLENDWWIWSVIFTALALGIMGLATLFSISIGTAG
jgi:hypothetical protein